MSLLFGHLNFGFWIGLILAISVECGQMAQWNLFDVVNSVILKFPTDDL